MSELLPVMAFTNDFIAISIKKKNLLFIMCKLFEYNYKNDISNVFTEFLKHAVVKLEVAIKYHMPSSQWIFLSLCVLLHKLY